MEPVKLFLSEVTEELLYNIVYNAGEIDYHTLSDEFEEKTGNRPMEFFGFGNKTGCGWLDFIDGIPGLKGRTMISVCDDDSDDDDELNYVYKMFNTTYLNENGENTSTAVTVATYRQMLLTKCCEIMKGDFADLSRWRDGNGNSPLHFIAGLPGITYDCPTLVKHLLQAGVDPLQENNDGQTFLHVIFGRFKAEDGDNWSLCFRNRVATTAWFVEDRVDLLNLLSEELSQAQIASLAKAQDKSGNTVIHECALTTPIEEEHVDEGKIYQKLLGFGASLRVSNNYGELPLHYAFNPKAFQIFHQNGAVCRARNDRDETPILFILKYAVDLSFSETPASTELAEQRFVKLSSGRSFQKASKLLENLTKIIKNVQAKETVWIPDMEGNVAIDILLIAIKLGSYDFLDHLDFMSQLRIDQIRLILVELLTDMLANASTSDMKQQNKKGQSFLHVLLDLGDGNKHVISNEVEILQSVELLLMHEADVKAVDLQGRTPLDITYKHYDKRPSLYGKISSLLIKYGAISKLRLGCNSSSPSTTQSFIKSKLVQGMSNLNVQYGTPRKLRSCPKRHLNSAKRLTVPNTQVTVVEKYRYSNQDSIGSGAFSTIFVAVKDENVDSRSGTIECRAYALKRLDKAKMNAQEIKREITTLLSISGKCVNITNYYESVEDEFFQYLCLDLMDGDLNEFVTNVNVNSVLKADPAVAVQVTNEIINGLAYLHENNFIHRDLKPGNILYTTDPTLHFKIADFGLTKNMSTSSTMTSTRGSGVAMALGTRCWMAPELVSMKSREHTQQSDVFSLGLVLHYLLTLGKHPFVTADEEASHVIERRIAEMQVHLDKALHPEAVSLLQILLAKVPLKRPPAKYLKQHPFLWSESKKIEFLKAVGDQQEAVNPGNSSNSSLEQRLQSTQTGQNVNIVPWDQVFEKLFKEMTTAWRQKKYRTGKVIDLIRFIRNAYAHKQERSSETLEDLDKNIFLRKYPSLVLDVFDVVQELGLHVSRSSILQALRL